MASFQPKRRRRVGPSAIAIAAAIGVAVLLAVVPALDAAGGKSRHSSSHASKHHSKHSSKHLKSLPRTALLMAAVLKDDDDGPEACPSMSASSSDGRSAENQMEQQDEHACPPCPPMSASSSDGRSAENQMEQQDEHACPPPCPPVKDDDDAEEAQQEHQMQAADPKSSAAEMQNEAQKEDQDEADEQKPPAVCPPCPPVKDDDEAQQEHASSSSSTSSDAQMQNEAQKDDQDAAKPPPANCNADLEITKKADLATATSGQTITYTITVTNDGPATVPFASIVVTDTMGTPTLVGPPPVSLAAGESVTYTLTHVVTAAECNTMVVNTAMVALAKDSGLVHAPGNDSASATTSVTCVTPPVTPPVNPPVNPPVTPVTPPVTPPATPPAATPPAATPPAATPPGASIAGGTVKATPARLTVVKTGPATAASGSIVRYTIRVKNVGGTTARSVKLSDLLPKGTTIAPRQLSKLRAASVKVSGGKLTWSLGNLAPGASRTVTISLQIGTQGGRLTNLAQAAAANARAVRATAKTLVKKLPAQTLPKVTG